MPADKQTARVASAYPLLISCRAFAIGGSRVKQLMRGASRQMTKDEFKV